MQLFISPENSLALSTSIDSGADESFTDFNLGDQLQLQLQTLPKPHQAHAHPCQCICQVTILRLQIKINLHIAYHLIQIQEEYAGGEMPFNILRGHYEYVMSCPSNFNASTIFQSLVNDTFRHVECFWPCILTTF